MFPKITHIIFDLDGLLLDTESLHEKVNTEIAQRYGKIFDKLVKAKIAGRPTLESAQILVDYLKLPITPEVYLQQRYELLSKRTRNAKLPCVTPGDVARTAILIAETLSNLLERDLMRISSISLHYFRKLWYIYCI